MWKLLRIAAVVLTAGFLVAVTLENVAHYYGLGPAGGDPPDPTASPDAGESPSSGQPTTDGPEPPGHAQSMLVRFVWDGDTVELQVEESGEIVTTLAKIPVRLIGIDAPEIESQNRDEPSECYGDETTEFLRELLPVDTPVLVDRDRSTRDDFDRRLLYVWRAADGLFVNYELVAEGYGEAIRVWPNVAYWDELEQAQRQAQRAELGMWGAC
jgi:micrococcal nuclease